MLLKLLMIIRVGNPQISSNFMKNLKQMQTPGNFLIFLSELSHIFHYSKINNPAIKRYIKDRQISVQSLPWYFSWWHSNQVKLLAWPIKYLNKRNVRLFRWPIKGAIIFKQIFWCNNTSAQRAGQATRALAFVIGTNRVTLIIPIRKIP